MRTTRRPRLPLAPLLRAYGAAGVPKLEQLVTLPGFGARWDAIVRARANWLNERILAGASDEQFGDAVTDFYTAVVPAPLFLTTLLHYLPRVRRGVEHLLRSTDSLAVRIQRCLNEDGAFAVPGLGPSFWSAVVQSVDPLRLPAWTADTNRGARRLGLIQRKHHWYGDLICACERIRQRDQRLTATHVDHFLTLVGRMRNRDLHSAAGFEDPIPSLIEAERERYPLAKRIAERSATTAEARESLHEALHTENVECAITALELIDLQVGADARAWDPAALLQWIAWIWHDDEPLAEIAACERQSVGAGLALTAAVLHVRSPERYPQWTRAAAAGLARIADAPAVNYAMYVEAAGDLAQRYWLHPFEVPAIFGRVAETQVR